MYTSDIFLCDSLHTNMIMQKLENKYKIISHLYFLKSCEEHCENLSQRIVNICTKLALKIHLCELNVCISKNVTNLKKFRDDKKMLAIAKII